MSGESPEHLALAYEFAADLARQLITLAAGIVGFSVTLVKEAPALHNRQQRKLVLASWSLFLASILFGIWSLMGLTGSLAAEHSSGPLQTIDSNVTLPAGLQILFFLIACVTFVAYGFRTLRK